MKKLILAAVLALSPAAAWAQIQPLNGTVPYASNGAWGNSQASGGSGSVFLAGDGSWKVPGGGGGSGTVTSIATGQGLTGGTITASGTISCVNFGSSLVGCVPASGGGTTNFLRADGTWAVPPGTGGISIPNAALLSGNGTTLGSVALGTNLSLSGSFPTQTLNATGGGGGLSGMTSGQIPVAASASTVTSSIPQSTWLFSAAGNSTLAGSGVRCVHVDATGLPSPTSGDCATGGSGSVTSVTLSSPGGIFAISGTNPITTTGTFGYTTTGTSGGVPYFNGSSTLSSSGVLSQYGVVIGGGAAAAPITVAPSTSGYVLTSNGGAANPTFQPAAGGGTAVLSIGTFSGSVGVYTTTGTTPAFASNTASYRFCGFWPSSLAAPTGTATLAVGTASALPLRVRSANGGIIPFTGKEIIPGTNGNTFCVQADGSAASWVLDSQAPGNSTVNPSSPYAVTQGDWASQGFFLQTTSGTTYNLPNLASTTLSSQAGITIQTSGVTAQLCAAGSDVINTGLLTGASSAGGCISLPADGTFLISTSGTAGSTAWTVPLGPLTYFTLTWAEGLNLSTNARYVSRFASPKVIYGIKCNVQAAAGSSSTVHLFSTASGTAPSGGTALDTTGCNANTASNTEQDMGVAGSPAGVGTTTPGYTIWATFSGSGTSGNGGLTITYR